MLTTTKALRDSLHCTRWASIFSGSYINDVTRILKPFFFTQCLIISFWYWIPYPSLQLCEFIYEWVLSKTRYQKKYFQSNLRRKTSSYLEWFLNPVFSFFYQTVRVCFCDRKMMRVFLMLPALPQSDNFNQILRHIRVRL